MKLSDAIVASYRDCGTFMANNDQIKSMATELLQLRQRVAEMPMLDMRVLNNVWRGLKHTPENEDHFVNCHICSSVYEVECYLQKHYVVTPLPPQESEVE